MATVRNRQTSTQTARRSGGNTDLSTQTFYISGSNALKLETLPVDPAAPKVSAQARRNREKALQMNLGYVVFLAAAAVLTVTICVNYLNLQSRYTSAQKENTVLSTRLSSMKLDNDAEYNRIISSVNLEDVKEQAMDRLGMVYASSDQIVEYSEAESDYAQQYKDVP